MNNIILSIHHRHAENILSGKKTVELRKSLPREMPGKVYLYDTKEKKIVGYFVPKKMYKEDTVFIDILARLAAVTVEELNWYYRNTKYCRWYAIGYVLRFVNPIPLPTGTRAPQNFIYCGELQ